MKIFQLLFVLFFVVSLTPFSTLRSQVPFQGVVTTNVMPIKKADYQSNIHVLYHHSFDGNLKVFVNNELIMDKEVAEGESEKFSLGGQISGSPQSLMKIVIDDLFFLEQILYFHHRFIRIKYDKEERRLLLSYEDHLPSSDQLQQDQLEQEVIIAIREQLNK